MSHVLIVGGGVVGLSIAYELARRQQRVTLLERGELGREASWAGAGILPPAVQQADAHPYDQLRGLSFMLHAEWAESLRAEAGVDTGYRRCGGVYVARSPGEAASIAGMVGFLAGEGVRAEPLSGEELARLEPELAVAARSGRIQASCLLPDEAQLRNPRHLQALIAACRRRGVDLHERVEVRGFESEAKRLTTVATDRGPFSADVVCVTAGAWTRELLAPLGARVGVLPIRGQMLLFSGFEPTLRRIVNEGPRYLVPRDDGRLLVGSSEEEAGFDKRTTPEVLAELQEFAFALAPGLRTAVLERSWSGLRPASFDGFPYMGRLPGWENAFVAAGHFRSGLYLSPGTATVMSQLMLGETPAIDLTPFRASRG